MPRSDGTDELPPSGRESVMEIKRYEGEVYAGAIVNRLEGRMAPSRVLVVVTETFCSMMEFAGKASPITPVKTGDRGSASTVVAAAAEGMVVEVTCTEACNGRT